MIDRKITEVTSNSKTCTGNGDSKSMGKLRPMLAKKYESQNPTGWLMSEKFDGVRALWNGKSLLSRNGNIFNAPDSFLEGLPSDLVLDGELWEGCGHFQQTVGKVRSNQGDWSGVNFMIFDLIDTQKIYSERLSKLQALRLAPHVQLVSQHLCRGNASLKAFEKEVISRGGEGVILRNPEALYEHNRSNSLLKIKRFQTDEATVTGYSEGRGRVSGSVGALICKYREKLIQIGSGLSDHLRDNPPEIGEKVTFQFFDLTLDGFPRHPVFVSARNYE